MSLWAQPDFATLHAPLMRALRATGDLGLAYLPPRFYQAISLALPYHFALGAQVQSPPAH